MATPEPRTRRCEGCGYRFIPDGPDDRFCSGICAGSPPVTSLIAEARRLAAHQALAARRGP
jgi:hypothetical protein